MKQKKRLYIRDIRDEINRNNKDSIRKTGLQAFISNESVNVNSDIDVGNVIATGMKRKLKKKLKKLQKQDLDDE